VNLFKTPAAKALLAAYDARSAYLRVTVEPTPGNVRKLRSSIRKASRAAARLTGPDARGLRNNLMTAETDAAGAAAFWGVAPLADECLASVGRCTANALEFAYRIPGACG
jgi:hypothetical protein